MWECNTNITDMILKLNFNLGTLNEGSIIQY
jgi:hypothetical protein